MGIQKVLGVNTEDKGQEKDCCHSRGHNLTGEQELQKIILLVAACCVTLIKEWRPGDRYRLRKCNYKQKMSLQNV